VSVLALFGPLSMCVMFIVLGMLSRRLGRVNRTPPYYVGFFVAALLVGVSLIVHISGLGWNAESAARLAQDTTLMLIDTGLMALGATIAAFVAWRYWSWLLAERG